MTRIIAALLLTACAPADDCPPMPDPQPIYDNTAASWETEVGLLPADYEYITVDTSSVPAGEFTDCPGMHDGTLLGCNRWLPLESRYRVQVLECRSDTAETLRHEYAHVLLHFMYGDPDGGHTDLRVWGTVASTRSEP